ncbi:AAA family ATPase [Candidatus Poribacteria bacterium]|nr:AAA family ATPase [Candidatus Poribacteria bacterium]
MAEGVKMPRQLNPEQENISRSIDGIYVVDAGAGTGKTTTITERYRSILEKVSPDRILLLTFTDNAAEHMRDEIINQCSDMYNIWELMDAPISTFHSYCNGLLKKHGLSAPEYLGIQEKLHNYRVMENSIYERQIFKTFFGDFRERNPKYVDLYKVIEDTEVLSLIKRLCCKGIFPTKDAWFGNGIQMLEGDFAGYMERFRVLNEPGQGKNGKRTQSEFLKSFKPKFRENIYISHPEEEELFNGVWVNPEMAESAFCSDDRTLLMKFVYDAYLEYIKFCMHSNQINFEFMIMFAFVLLHGDHGLREKTAFDYVMVDEFQDTNELQFMMTLLLMKTNNLCAVGDWKQGIYSFRYATIDNILDFDDKIEHYRDVLNIDYTRVSFDTDTNHKEFVTNYRSSQKILDFSENSLIARATKEEKIDESVRNEITHLLAGKELDDKTNIEFMMVDDTDKEYYIILGKIREMVQNSEYMLKDWDGDKYTLHPVDYRDIAVLTRTRIFGLELQTRATEYGIPVNYDGGIELFRTQPAILVLAWLRLMVNVRNSNGWIPVLEKEGYSFAEIRTIIHKKQWPERLLQFRGELLKQKSDLAALVDNILNFYGFTCDYSNALVVELEELFRNSLASVPDLIGFIEESINQNETQNIDINRSENAVTIQTIHGAKGLEYPVVFIVDVNSRHFPSTITDSDMLYYHDLTGLRIRKEYGEKNGHKFVFNKWQSDLLSTKLFSDYDEERRLLYVAITRAKQYLVFTANPTCSTFFKDMADGFEVIEDYHPANIENMESIDIGGAEVLDEIIIGDYEKQGNVFSVHDLMQYSSPELGKGMDFGNELHNFAQKVALGIDVQWNEPEAERIRSFITSLKARELRPEVQCSLPLGNDLIRGKIDLVAFCDDGITIVDYKSDLTEINEGEYQKQLSVYYHVLRELHPDKPIYCSLYYVSMDIVKGITPFSLEKTREFLKCSIGS